MELNTNNRQQARERIQIVDGPRVPVPDTGMMVPTGGHRTWDLSKPQSIAVLRNQLDWATSPTVDLRGQMFHICNQQMTISDKVRRIVGGVFVIEPGRELNGNPAPNGRAGILIRDRAVPLEFDGTVFVIIGNTPLQEAAVYSYACTGVVTLRNCHFGGLPHDQTRLPESYQELSTGPAARAVSCKPAAGAPSGGVVIDRCAFVLGDQRDYLSNSSGIEVISVAGVLAGNQRNEYQRTKKPVAITQPVRQVQITRNLIIGGYYGIGLSAVTGGTVSGNLITESVRGISAQDSCSGIVIESNRIYGYRSTAIHMAYGTNGVTVRANVCESSQVNGQAHIQGYCSVTGVRIEANHVAATQGSPGPSFGLYLGNGSSGSIVGNIVSGPCQKACIGVEQSWAGDTGPLSYTKTYSGDTPLGVTENVTGVTLSRNVIQSTSVAYYASSGTGTVSVETDWPFVNVSGKETTLQSRNNVL